MNRKTVKTVFFLLFLGAILIGIRSVYLTANSDALDFSVLFLGAKDLSIGKNPYINPEIFTAIGYPANTLLFYFPFLLFSYDLAQTLFLITTFISIFLSIYFSGKIILKKLHWYHLVLPTILVFISFPTRFTIGMGQNNTIALLILLLAYYSYRKRNLPAAGLLLGSVIAFKTIFVFFLLFFILKREWKIILFSLIPLILSTVIVILLSGINIYQYYFSKVIPPLLDISGREIYYNQGILGFVSRFTTALSVRKYIGGFLSLGVLITTMCLTIRKGSENLQFSLYIIALLLLDSLSWQHHFVWLIYPFFALIDHVITKKTAIKKLSLVLIAISYVLISWNIKQPTTLTIFPKELWLSHTFIGTAIIFVVNSLLIYNTEP